MSPKGRLRSLLDTATLHVQQGDHDVAERILAEIADAGPGDELGHATALQMPRKLHSAQLKLAKARKDARTRIALQFHLVPPPELLAQLFQAQADDRERAVRAAATPVPRLLHQVWIGSPPPETTGIWAATARRHGWEYRLWGEDALKAEGITRDPVFGHMRALDDLPGATDVARYHILSKHGGLYLDCDWLPVGDTRFEQVFPGVGLSAIAEETPRLTGTGSAFLNNSVIAAPPGHPVFDALLAALPKVSDLLPKGPAWWATGPLVFTLAARRGPVTLLDAGLIAGSARAGADRAAVMAEIAALEPGPGFLFGWKPWEDA